MTRQTSPRDVRRAFLLRQEIALLDLREEYHFAFDHPLFAASLPLSRLEIEAVVGHFFGELDVARFPLPGRQLSFYSYLAARRPNRERAAAYLANRA